MRLLPVLLAALGARIVQAGVVVPPATGGLWISSILNPQQCLSEQVVVYGGVAPYQISIVSGADYDTVLAANIQAVASASTFWWCITVAQGVC
jgi:hypothetical protein